MGADEHGSYVDLLAPYPVGALGYVVGRDRSFSKSCRAEFRGFWASLLPTAGRGHRANARSGYQERNCLRRILGGWT